MPADARRDAALPDLATLLVSGGDARIALDPATGLSMYGCSPQPDPQLVALGSSTASLISTQALAACALLREEWLRQLVHRPPDDVYAGQAQRLRERLLALCGLHGDEAPGVVLAASGTDLHLLIAQWLKPKLTVSIVPAETGSGVGAALEGRHFNRRTAGGADVTSGAWMGERRGVTRTLEARTADGVPRAAADIDAECAALVEAAAADGQSVLLIVTDVSKTGLLVPSVAVALDLQRRWPQQVDVLVDACQFRLAPATVRAYLAHGFSLALTGSKFMAGPTFSGALLVAPRMAQRHAHRELGDGARAYSNAADWPSAWAAGETLPDGVNFGLLLRWEAALTEMAALVTVDENVAADFLRRFAAALTARLAQDAHFSAVPVPPLQRAGLGKERRWDAQMQGPEREVRSVSSESSWATRSVDMQPQWDTVQTIFPFLLHGADGVPVSQERTLALYRALREPPAAGDAETRRFQLGQPVPCGVRDGVAVSALRLCVSAPMLVAACRDGRHEALIADALAALDRLVQLLDA